MTEQSLYFEKEVTGLLALLRSIRHALSNGRDLTLTPRGPLTAPCQRPRTQLEQIAGGELRQHRTAVCRGHHPQLSGKLSCSLIGKLQPFETEVSNDITPPTAA